jgi:hypothetical protein
MAESRSAGAAPGGKPQTPSSTNLKKAELRRHIRFSVERVSARVYPKGFLTAIGMGKFLTNMGVGGYNEERVVVNLSESGALIVLDSKFAPGTKVKVRIEMERFKDVIETEGEIRWCYQSARDATEYYAGVMFRNLPASQASRIAKMRDWFTSPEYKMKSSTRRKMKAFDYDGKTDDY